MNVEAHLQVRLNGLEAGLWDVLLVEVHQGVQERVHLGHRHLRRLPATILGDFAARGHQNHDRRRDVGHRHHRGAEGLQLGEVVLGDERRRRS